MPKRLTAATVALLAALLAISPAVFAQTDGWGKPVPVPDKNHKAAPAPKLDISGTWEPAGGPGTGVQPFGAKNMPADGKHDPPYSAAGLAALNLTKPSNGNRMVLPADSNDPVITCNTQGMPREDLYEFRTTQILQTPEKVAILYEFGKVWRTIWTDGRDFPKNPEPRWYGYSIGKWADDTTFVVQTIGLDDRAWVDRAGRPKSEQMRVEERFHRVDHDRLEITVTIDDPKMYTKPWVALDKFPMKLEPADFDVREMICSPLDFDEYNQLIGNPASGQ
jgi:hypothetical protein